MILPLLFHHLLLSLLSLLTAASSQSPPACVAPLFLIDDCTASLIPSRLSLRALRVECSSPSSLSTAADVLSFCCPPCLIAAAAAADATRRRRDHFLWIDPRDVRPAVGRAVFDIDGNFTAARPLRTFGDGVVGYAHSVHSPSSTQLPPPAAAAAAAAPVRLPLPSEGVASEDAVPTVAADADRDSDGLFAQISSPQSAFSAPRIAPSGRLSLRASRKLLSESPQTVLLSSPPFSLDCAPRQRSVLAAFKVSRHSRTVHFADRTAGSGLCSHQLSLLRDEPLPRCGSRLRLHSR
jgi:hypothetical protein